MTTKDTFLVLQDTGLYTVTAIKQGYCNSSSDAFHYPCIPGLALPYIYLGKDTLFVSHAEADSFIWYRNGQFYAAGRDSIILLSDTGLFTATALKSKYCRASSEPLFVACLDKLLSLIIWLSKDTLFAIQNQADSFVWYRNGQKLKTSKEAFIKLTDTGIYYAEAIKKLHCTRSSASLHVSELKTNLNNVSKNNVRIYPNPADESFTIETESDDLFMVRLYDYEGKMVFEKQTDTNKAKLDISTLTQGLYIIELSNYKTLFHYKIAIQ